MLTISNRIEFHIVLFYSECIYYKIVPRNEDQLLVVFKLMVLSAQLIQALS